MKKVKVCPECGVPKEISKENRWQNSGAILTFDGSKEIARERSSFYEVSGLSELFQNIEGLIGQPIFHIIVEARRKDTLGYLEEYLSGLRGVLARSIGGRTVYKTVATIGATFGLGHFEIQEIKRGEYFTVYCNNVYSIPLLVGDLIATFNAVERSPAAATLEERENGLLCTISRGEEDTTISSRLKAEYVAPKPGSIHFDRCTRCNTPLRMKDVVYDYEEGIIKDKKTGRRMTFLSTSNLEAIFRELEVELGKEIIPIIIEAQKDYAKNTLQSEEIAGESDVRNFFALRGLGNLIDYDLNDNRLEARMENAYPYLLVIGLMHGMFEILTGREGEISYAEDNDKSLLISIKAI